MDIREIIEKGGGAPRIAEESERLAALDPVTYRIAKVKAVYKWATNGIPEWHWPVVARLSGVTEIDIYKANRELEAASKSPHPKRRASARVAA